MVTLNGTDTFHVSEASIAGRNGEFQKEMATAMRHLILLALKKDDGSFVGRCSEKWTEWGSIDDDDIEVDVGEGYMPESSALRNPVEGETNLTLWALRWVVDMAVSKKKLPLTHVMDWGDGKDWVGEAANAMMRLTLKGDSFMCGILFGSRAWMDGMDSDDFASISSFS